jgi:hypothetical protein
MKKVAVIILIVIPLIAINFSGCIDIEIAKGLMGEEEKPKGFHTVTKRGFPVEHEFDLTEDITGYDYQKTHPIFVKGNTRWMNITFQITINDFEPINLTNESLRDIIIELLNLVHRHVEITLTNSKGEEIVQGYYEESVDLQLFAEIEDPMEGTWVISIEAIGAGYQGQFQDGFMVDVECYEPA